jgi:hypothetical protein
MSIKFIPIERHISSPLSDPENFVHNLSNDKLAERLSDRFEGKSCKHHPYTDSIIEVDMALPSHEWLKLKSYCCDEWRESLDKICQNQDPFMAPIGHK